MRISLAPTPEIGAISPGGFVIASKHRRTWQPVIDKPGPGWPLACLAPGTTIVPRKLGGWFGVHYKAVARPKGLHF